MKILIILSKNNLQTNPKLTLSFDDVSIDYELTEMSDSIRLVIPNKAVGVHNLRITRDEPFENTTHVTWVKVESIKIDDFWEIGDLNHWSKTEYAPEYVRKVQEQDHSWELTADLYNDTFWFNGSLLYEIPVPVRKMFWT